MVAFYIHMALQLLRFFLDALKLKDSEAQIADLQSQLAASQKENNILRQQLIAILQSHYSQSNDNPSTPRPSSVSYSDYERLVLKVDVLQKQLLESNDDRKTEGRARRILVNKLKTAKATAREWMNYSIHQESKGVIASSSSLVRKPPALSPGVEPLEDIVLPNDKLLLLEDDQLPTPFTEKLSQSIHQPQNDLTQDHNAEANVVSRISSEDSNLIPSSQQETVPTNLDQFNQESNKSVPIIPAIDDSDDLPVVVAERAVKRRRIRKKRNNEEEQEALDLVKIKMEPKSPAVVVNFTETLDLDEVGIVVHTPRRLTKSKRPSLSSDSHSSELRQERSQSESLDIRQNQQMISVAQTIEIFPAVGSSRREDLSSNDCRSQSQPPEKTGESEERIGQSTRLFEKRAPLKDIDINERLLPSTKKDNTHKRRLYGYNERSRTPKTIHKITEDGEILSENKHHSKSVQSAKEKERLQKSFARLNALLDDNNSSTPTRITRVSRKRSVPDLQDPTIQNKVHDEQHSSTKAKFKSLEKPLRALPLSSLTLADFKLNPELNRGVDYAFNDSIYGNERRCLPGCTDPRCCGEAMRALASALKPTLPRSTHFASAEDALLTDEEFLMKWFLGAKWNRQEISRMPTASREKLLLDAQTKLVAEQYGKHRNVSDRRMTPPGFWDSDIPSTQEQQMQRREAEKMERTIVSERHREAMKRGKWLFRDE